MKPATPGYIDGHICGKDSLHNAAQSGGASISGILLLRLVINATLFVVGHTAHRKKGQPLPDGFPEQALHGFQDCWFTAKKHFQIGSCTDLLVSLNMILGKLSGIDQHLGSSCSDRDDLEREFERRCVEPVFRKSGLNSRIEVDKTRHSQGRSAMTISYPLPSP